MIDDISDISNRFRRMIDDMFPEGPEYDDDTFDIGSLNSFRGREPDLFDEFAKKCSTHVGETIDVVLKSMSESQFSKVEASDFSCDPVMNFANQFSCGDLASVDPKDIPFTKRRSKRYWSRHDVKEKNRRGKRERRRWSMDNVRNLSITLEVHDENQQWTTEAILNDIILNDINAGELGRSSKLRKKDKLLDDPDFAPLYPTKQPMFSLLNSFLSGLWRRNWGTKTVCSSSTENSSSKGSKVGKDSSSTESKRVKDSSSTGSKRVKDKKVVRFEKGQMFCRLKSIMTSRKKSKIKNKKVLTRKKEQMYCRLKSFMSRLWGALNLKRKHVAMASKGTKTVCTSSSKSDSSRESSPVEEGKEVLNVEGMHGITGTEKGTR